MYIGLQNHNKHPVISKQIYPRKLVFHKNFKNNDGFHHCCLKNHKRKSKNGMERGGPLSFSVALGL